MSGKAWTREEAKAFAARNGLEVRGDEDIERMMILGARLADVAAHIKRMPSKSDEPCSLFKVPQ